MTANSFSTGFTVDQTPEQVFAAVTNVRDWWIGDLSGETTALGDEFTYRHEDVHRSTQRITEVTPYKRVVWRVVDAELNFVSDKTEWNGTEIVFDIARQGDQTQLRFTHSGLEPTVECFDLCSSAWGHYINVSLKNLITGAKPD